MTRLALAILVTAATGLGLAAHHQHKRPTVVVSTPSASSVIPLRASRSQERQPLPGVHARISGEGVTPQSRRAPVRRGPSRPALGSGLHNWNAVADCESSGDWHANTGNGFYGGLQFTQQTWAAYGGLRYASRADLASSLQQVLIAERVLRDQGPMAWPVCSLRVGMR